MICRTCLINLEKEWRFCPLCGRDQKKERKSFLVVYQEWEERYCLKISHSTLNCYRAAKKYYEPIFEKAFCLIDLADLQFCVDQCQKGKRTRENMKALGSLLYKYALPRHLSEMNYALYLETGKKDKRDYLPFNTNQIETIRQSLDRVCYAEEIYALIYTGFRPAELFALKKKDYQLVEGVACLIGGVKTTAGRDRVITISPKIAPIIEKRLQSQSEYLFPYKEKSMSTKTFREKCFYPALEQMGIQPMPKPGAKPLYVPYSCRHTFSNLLKYVTGSDRDKADLMGHADYCTTRRIYQTAEVLAKKAITDSI